MTITPRIAVEVAAMTVEMTVEMIDITIADMTTEIIITRIMIEDGETTVPKIGTVVMTVTVATMTDRTVIALDRLRVPFVIKYCFMTPLSVYLSSLIKHMEGSVSPGSRQQTIKILLLGDSGVGKSCLLLRFTKRH